MGKPLSEEHYKSWGHDPPPVGSRPPEMGNPIRREFGNYGNNNNNDDDYNNDRPNPHPPSHPNKHKNKKKKERKKERKKEKHPQYALR